MGGFADAGLLLDGHRGVLVLLVLALAGFLVWARRVAVKGSGWAVALAGAVAWLGLGLAPARFVPSAKAPRVVVPRLQLEEPRWIVTNPGRRYTLQMRSRLDGRPPGVAYRLTAVTSRLTLEDGRVLSSRFTSDVFVGRCWNPVWEALEATGRAVADTDQEGCENPSEGWLPVWQGRLPVGSVPASGSLADLEVAFEAEMLELEGVVWTDPETTRRSRAVVTGALHTAPFALTRSFSQVRLLTTPAPERPRFTTSPDVMFYRPGLAEGRPGLVTGTGFSFEMLGLLHPVRTVEHRTAVANPTSEVAPPPVDPSWLAGAEVISFTPRVLGSVRMQLHRRDIAMPNDPVR